MFTRKNRYSRYYKKEKFKERVSKKKRARKALFVSNALLSLGVFIFVYLVLVPSVFSYTYSPKSSKFVKPFEESVLSYIYKGINDNFYFEELNPDKWEPKRAESVNIPETFEITIPKLDIYDAVVETDSENMKPDEMLGHYKGTSLPGQVGNSFVYGHSSLPIFYDPEDYKTIFTKVPDLEPGDIIEVEYKDKKYTYKVRVEKEMLPEEVNPFGSYYPSLYNKSTLTLMTCTPPGSKKYRYIVLAELI